MAKQLTFTYEGKDYTLEFTRATIRELENKGLVVADVEKKPMTVLPALFAGAFLKHHRFVKQSVIDDIFDHITQKQDLINKLAEMYNEPIQALVEEPEESEKNVEWTGNW